MRNLNIYNITDTPNSVINDRLDYLQYTVSILEQTMMINQRCYNALIGTDHDATMIRWKLHKAYLILQTQWNDCLNETFYLQDLQERAEEHYREQREAIKEALLEQAREAEMHDAYIDEIAQYDEHSLDLYYDGIDAFEELEDRGDVDNPALDHIGPDAMEYTSPYPSSYPQDDDLPF